MTNITVTEAASTYIKTMLENKPGNHFRLTIKKTGCSGFSYAPMLVENIITTDECVATSVPIYLDVTWLHLLDGVMIDYVIEDKNGLKQKRLVFTNNKEAGRCGCGESFHV